MNGVDTGGGSCRRGATKCPGTPGPVSGEASGGAGNARETSAQSIVDRGLVLVAVAAQKARGVPVAATDENAREVVSAGVG